MAATFELEVVTPERLLIREQASFAQIPLAKGYVGILPGHAPLLSELSIGTLSYEVGGRQATMAVSGGWAEVLPDRVRVLATAAERADDIDVKRAQAAFDRAQDRILHTTPDIDVARALNALKRAQARLAAAAAK